MARIGLALVLSLALSVLLGQAGTTQAQGDRTVVIGGLDAPRGLAFGPDGTLYVAEAGSGGDEESAWVPPFLRAKIGTSGRILRVDGGQSTVVASGIQSIALGPAGETVGPQDLAFVGSTIYVLVGQANALPTGKQTFSLLVKVGTDGKVETVADLGKFERENNPDGTVPDSNPFGIAPAPDGSLFVTDAGGNDLLKVTTAGAVSAVKAWNDDPVPTSVAVDKSGSALVVFLTGAPFPAGGSRMERVTGTSSEVVLRGLTMAVDVKVGPDGLPYVLEHSSEFVLSPPPPKMLPNTGRVLRIAPGGPQVVASGLNFPTKMAFGPDGALYVSNNANGVPPKSGEIVKLTLPANGTPVTLAPAAQPSPAAAPPSPAAAPSTGGPLPPAPTPAAKPAAPVQAPAPVSSPSALPRTGIAPDAIGAVVPLASAGAALTVVGIGLLRRRRNR